MKNKEILEILTNQYLKNIADITNNYTNALHLIYREGDFTDDELIWIFWDLEKKSARYWSYKDDKEWMYFHEEDIFLEAKKAKENYDTYR